MLSPESIASIRDSWETIEPLAPEAADSFYGRLFELDPGLRRLFTGDMGEQGQKLMRMIAIAVNGLDRLPEIIPAIEDLGRRHRDYGVSTADYDKVGAALLWTLEGALGSPLDTGVADCVAGRLHPHRRYHDTGIRKGVLKARPVA